MDDQLKELARDLSERAATYSFLARALSDEDLPTEFLSALAAEVPQTGTDLDAFATSLAVGGSENLERARKDMAADHAATLLGMSAAPVSPYESVHTSSEELMMQEARDRAVAAYRASGFAVAEDCHVPEDHIATELAFMAGLGERAAAQLGLMLSGEVTGDAAGEAMAQAETAMNAQLDFLEKSLLPWVPGFCDVLERRAFTGFYRGVAQMLREFMVQEAAYLADIQACEEC